MVRNKTASSINLDAPPSEVLSQMLFVSYAQRFASSLSKTMVLFAPTQPEEELTGYDVSLIGKGCRELYLQFKRGYPDERSEEVRFKVDNSPTRRAGIKQLDTLKKKYPPLSAFYVAAGFWDVRCSLEAQNSVSSDRDFLDLYGAISAHAVALPKRQQTSQVSLGSRYYPYGGSAKSYNPYKIRDANSWTHGVHWFLGSELFEGFLRRSDPSVGCSIEIRGGQVVRVPNRGALGWADEGIPVRAFADVLYENQRIPRYSHSDSTVTLTVRVFD
jgi:hypothetical protein